MIYGNPAPKKSWRHSTKCQHRQTINTKITEHLPYATVRCSKFDLSSLMMLPHYSGSTAVVVRSQSTNVSLVL